MPMLPTAVALAIELANIRGIYIFTKSFNFFLQHDHVGMCGVMSSRGRGVCGLLLVVAAAWSGNARRDQILTRGEILHDPLYVVIPDRACSFARACQLFGSRFDASTSYSRLR